LDSFWTDGNRPEEVADALEHRDHFGKRVVHLMQPLLSYVALSEPTVIGFIGESGVVANTEQSEDTSAGSPLAVPGPCASTKEIAAGSTPDILTA